MSIVRIGLAETKKFSTGYDAIFGKRKPMGVEEPKRPTAKAAKKPAKAKRGAKRKTKK